MKSMYEGVKPLIIHQYHDLEDYTDGEEVKTSALMTNYWWSIYSSGCVELIFNLEDRYTRVFCNSEETYTFRNENESIEEMMEIEIPKGVADLICDSANKWYQNLEQHAKDQKYFYWIPTEYLCEMEFDRKRSLEEIRIPELTPVNPND